MKDIKDIFKTVKEICFAIAWCLLIAWFVFLYVSGDANLQLKHLPSPTPPYTLNELPPIMDEITQNTPLHNIDYSDFEKDTSSVFVSKSYLNLSAEHEAIILNNINRNPFWKKTIERQEHQKYYVKYCHDNLTLVYSREFADLSFVGKEVGDRIFLAIFWMSSNECLES